MLAELRSQLADLDMRLALVLAAKDAKATEAETLKIEARVLNAERDPIARQVASLEAAERAAAGGPPPQKVGGG